jgi:hypothetical protein
VVFTHGLELFFPWATFTAFSTIASTTVTTLATFSAVAAGFVALLGPVTTRFVLATMGIVRALVGMNGGRMIVGMRRGGWLRFVFFAFAEAKHLFQAGFDAAEERGLFRGVVGASRRGHKR